ncbi:MAG: hypothetical protein ACI4HN_01350, partial [Ruminococcus sp.]
SYVLCQTSACKAGIGDFMSEKIKNIIFIAANCIAEILIILLLIIFAFVPIAVFLIPLIFIALNVLNCIFIKDYKVIFACTIVYELLPFLSFVLFGLDTNSIGGQINGMFAGVIMLTIAIWSVAVTVYKSIRHKGKY